jgi:hypothetical protein
MVLDSPAPLHGVASLANSDRAATVGQGAVTAPCALRAMWVRSSCGLCRCCEAAGQNWLVQCSYVYPFPNFVFDLNPNFFVKLQKFIENKIKVIKM